MRPHAELYDDLLSLVYLITRYEKDYVTISGLVDIPSGVSSILDD